jgi:multidrug efflux pump subunit AcrA (membrane-fusion protein)
MKGPAILLVACLFIGCGKEEPAARKAESPKPVVPAKPPDAPEVVIDEKTHQQLEIEVEQVRARKIPLMIQLAGRTQANELLTQPGGAEPDISTLWVTVTPNEKDLPRIRLGMPVELTAGDEPFPGVVTRVESGQVRVEVPNKDLQLKPDTEAIVDIQVGESAPGLYVPAAELQQVGGKTVLFVQKIPGHFEIRPVTVGRTVEDFREVTEGLKPGETVVINGSAGLKAKAVTAPF